MPLRMLQTVIGREVDCPGVIGVYMNSQHVVLMIEKANSRMLGLSIRHLKVQRHNCW